MRDFLERSKMANKIEYDEIVSRAERGIATSEDCGVLIGMIETLVSQGIDSCEWGWITVEYEDFFES